MKSGSLSSKSIPRGGEGSSPPNPLESVVDDHFERIKLAVRDALDLVAQDPLLKCFSESSESRSYMFDRIEEIFKSTVQAVTPPNLSAAYLNTFELQRTVYEWEKRATEAEAKASALQEQLRAQTQAVNKALEAKLDAAEERKQAAELKLVELEEVVANLRAKISPLETQLSKAYSKVSELEAVAKRQEFANKEKEEHLVREIKRHTDELDIERKKIKELHKQLTAAERGAEVTQGIEMQKISGLEDTVRQLRDALDGMERKLDESEFNKKTLEDHMVNLKKEISDGVEANSLIKKEKHQLELELIECHNKIGEITVKYNFLREQLEKAQTESDFSKNEIEKLEKSLKADKRKTCNMERELDQLRYSHDLLSKQSSEELKSLREQNTLLKAETKTLHERLETQYRELQTKMDEERKGANKAREKGKILESENENLKLELESLQQKVVFYKAQGLGNSQPKPDSLSQHEEDAMFQESRKSRKSDKFESFASFQKNVKEIELRIKDDHNSEPALHKETLKVQLSTLRMKVVHLKEVFRIENNSLRKEVMDLKSLLAQHIETLVAKMRIHTRRIRNNSPGYGNKSMNERNYGYSDGYADRENLREMTNRQPYQIPAYDRPSVSYQQPEYAETPNHRYGYDRKPVRPISSQNLDRSQFSPWDASGYIGHRPEPTFSPMRTSIGGEGKIRILRDTTTYHFDDVAPNSSAITPMRKSRPESPSLTHARSRPYRELDSAAHETPDHSRHEIQSSESRLDQLERNLMNKLRRDPRNRPGEPSSRITDRSVTPTRKNLAEARWG